MSDQPLVSILINNYNYGAFLSESIESALNQTYRHREIIVVDDGSTDNSRDIIEKYSGRIITVLKENGGQASALNGGFAKSKGDILCFLDSDDYFFSQKVEVIVELFRQITGNDSIQNNTMIYHLLQIVSKDGSDRDGTIPSQLFDREANLLCYARKYRFVPYSASPTSGLSISRSLAAQIFPIPESITVSADDFVVRASSLLGSVRGDNRCLAAYRVHGDNKWHGSTTRKSPEFMSALEEYLNNKLRERNLTPVIDFQRSMYAREYTSPSFIAYNKLAFDVLVHCCDLTTLKFFLRTQLLALKCLVGKI